ncbi:hypothetical protein PR202_ga06494 [Eleusine coracana subsp. coracana]|uniref:Uncharacterized protein n=1 Tax=Eleusine coracana subsp. coracana TaxID=191504 RepID=A0AAV5BYK9_ELECO|nr:hypothetical protein PR202_ga06494 [Eleusine coracana subsp. coracana]
MILLGHHGSHRGAAGPRLRSIPRAEWIEPATPDTSVLSTRILAFTILLAAILLPALAGAVLIYDRRDLLTILRHRAAFLLLVPAAAAVVTL